jgi:hypothetical protein
VGGTPAGVAAPAIGLNDNSRSRIDRSGATSTNVLLVERSLLIIDDSFLIIFVFIFLNFAPQRDNQISARKRRDGEMSEEFFRSNPSQKIANDKDIVFFFGGLLYILSIYYWARLFR